jgi:hypothetical protein
MSDEPEMTSRRSEGEHRGRIELPREELERRLNEVAERLVDLYLLGVSGEQLKCRIRELHEGLSRFSGWDKEILRERFLRCHLIYETQFQQLTVARRFAGPPGVACFLLDLLLQRPIARRYRATSRRSSPHRYCLSTAPDAPASGSGRRRCGPLRLAIRFADGCWSAGWCGSANGSSARLVAKMGVRHRGSAGACAASTSDRVTINRDLAGEIRDGQLVGVAHADQVGGDAAA